MKVSLSWLKEYVPIDMAVTELADALTMAGLEVEAVVDRYAFLETVVVGKVAAVRPHPNADRLSLCQVDGGSGLVPVVCGAPNVAAGMTVALALPGTRLPGGILLESSRIRGETSQGMLCSEIELTLGLDGSGLMVLDGALSPGSPLKSALSLSDVTFEIGLTPNRPDCLSVMGVAREVAAIQGVAMNPPTFQLPDTDGDIRALTSVTIQAPDHCPRYAARLVDRITVAPSPFWLQDRLRSVGVRPINNLVDVTNFVMLETGQPLHAFDFDHLAGHRIVVRTAQAGESFTTLDQKARTLTDQMLMICDGAKPVAVGGVMGGLNSEIEDATTRVLIESACFDPVSIRKTSKALALSTDASHRFERGVDPDGTLDALNRAAGLMAELGQGRLVGGVIDEDFRQSEPPVLTVSANATNRLLGTDLKPDQMAALLGPLGFGVTPAAGDALAVQVPSFRVDVTRPRDLMEEVARRYGYDRIPTAFPVLPAQGAAPSVTVGQRNRIRQLLAGFGFTEAINYSFISADSSDRLQLAADDSRRRHVALLNPISEEQAVMRTSLVPGMLETAQRNISRQQTTLRLYEIGNVFLPRTNETLPLETEMLVGLWSGASQPAAWHTREKACDFFDIKGIVEGLIGALGVAGVAFTALPDEHCRYTRRGYTARIDLNGQMLGIVGEVSDGVNGRYGLKQPTFIVELSLEPLMRSIVDTRQMMPIPRFPSISRDVTIIIDAAIESRRLLDTVARFDEPLAKDLQLFDVFAGDPIPPGKKSVSFRVVYQADDRTLEDEAVNRIHRQLIHRLVGEFDAALPA